MLILFVFLPFQFVCKICVTTVRNQQRRNAWTAKKNFKKALMLLSISVMIVAKLCIALKGEKNTRCHVVMKCRAFYKCQSWNCCLSSVLKPVTMFASLAVRIDGFSLTVWPTVSVSILYIL